ncbi:hypothetical protein PENSPDRAFT_645393 [Peniophora sp. CONT]|nr:hypothetical protein PENSPDRAFT_645393 [Peniophora sp. CONT]
MHTEGAISRLNVDSIEARAQFYRGIADAPASSCERANHLSTLYRDIDDVARPLALLHQRRNALVSPISRLHPELLSLVFHYIAQLEPHFCTDPQENYRSYMERRRKSFPLGWVKVTHVSTAWRTHALGDATLWTNVTLVHGRRWADEMLRRSGSAYLKLQIPAYGSNDAQDFIHIVRQAVSRATELDLIFSSDYLKQAAVVGNAVSTTVSRLQVLNVYAPTFAPIRMEDWEHFATSTELHTLQLRGIREFDWRGVYLANLTSLVVQQVLFRSHAGAPTIGDIRNALSRMIKLETLSIRHNKIEITEDSSVHHLPVLELKLLKRLSLDVPLPAAAALLCSLRVPTCDSVTLETFTYDRTLSTEQNQTISALCLILTSPNFPFRPIKTLELKSTGTKDSTTRRFAVAAWTSDTKSSLLKDFEAESEQSPPEPSFSITFRLRARSQNHPFNPAIFLDNLPMEHIVNLSLSAAIQPAYPPGSIRWDLLLPRCQSLQWLRADRDLGLDLLIQSRSFLQTEQRCLIPRTLSVLALLCIRWDQDTIRSQRADDLAGELWNTCNDARHRLEGLMVGTAIMDDFYEFFTSDVCDDIDFIRAPDRPQERDADGDVDDDWLEEMYHWDPLWMM